jgi:phage shock protein PspC (stress-responsive transcriptional regulator)
MFICFRLVGVYGRTIIVFPFALLSILAAIISWLILPETMGRDLQETIEEVEGIAKSYEMDPLESKREK